MNFCPLKKVFLSPYENKNDTQKLLANFSVEVPNKQIVF